MDFKKRIRNKALWLSVIAFIPLILKSFGIEVIPEQYNQIANAILGIFVLLGIANDPTTENTGFKDDNTVSAG